MENPIISLLTDFGLGSPYVGALRGVLLSIDRQLVLADICHEIPAHDILAGAFALSSAWRYFPPGTVHLAVVDPGVGGTRRPLAAQVGDHFFVGPDNGLLTLLADQGWVKAAHLIEPQNLGLYFPHPTFHGRDLFAPAAARLAQGGPLEHLGPPVDSLERLPLTPPRREGATLKATILDIDRFGNVTTNITPALLEELAPGPHPTRLALPGLEILPWAETYSLGPRDHLFVLWGSAGFLEVALDRASAALRIHASRGAELTLDLA